MCWQSVNQTCWVTGSQRKLWREMSEGQKIQASSAKETLSLGLPGRRASACHKNRVSGAAATEGRTNLVHVFIQGSGVDERDGGLLHAEESVLDASPAYGADHVPSGREHVTSQTMVSAIAATAVVVRSSRSSPERPGSSIQARKDKALMCSVTRYVLPAPSSKTPYASGTLSASTLD